MHISSPADHLPIEEAKARLTIPEVWRRLGLPGSPGRSCRCPWREDRRPSLSISADGRLWNDFGTGEGGDAVSFLARALGVPDGIALRRFREMAGGAPPTSRYAGNPSMHETLPRRLAPPAWHEGTTLDLARLAVVRRVRIEAVHIAVERGLVRFGDWKGRRAWFVTDPSLRNAQARRLDGHPWDEIAAKAWTLPGSSAAWPVGITTASPFPVIALVEGGPDLLAALHFALAEGAVERVAPVAMLGASARIAPDSILLFSGKRVRLFGHADTAGESAVNRWAADLVKVATSLDAFRLAGLRRTDGDPAKDLNDLTPGFHPDDFETHRQIENLFP